MSLSLTVDVRSQAGVGKPSLNTRAFWAKEAVRGREKIVGVVLLVVDSWFRCGIGPVTVVVVPRTGPRLSKNGGKWR